MVQSLKILTLDIETKPCVVHRWQLYGNDTTALSQLIVPGGLMCAAYKWYGEDEIKFVVADEYLDMFGTWSRNVDHLWHALNAADAVITYNGKKFDIPRLNTAFIERQLTPPSPYAHIDLYQTVRKVFGFPSNKLDYVSGRLLDSHKVTHQGHDLWVACMNKDPEAWSLMEEYNKHDVVLTEQLYDKLKPWIPNHPNVLLYDENPEIKGCPTCGSGRIHRRGERQLATGVYNRYQCNDCFSWFREIKRINGSTVR